MLDEHVTQIKAQKFRDQAAKQREKVKTLKALDANALSNEISKPESLNADALEQFSQASSKKPVQKSKKGGRPAWAMTEKMDEDAKEAEVDDLLEFAYELDYEKYMEDEEVRMALAVIKERVSDITKEDGWKEKMASEWNKAAVGQNDETRSQAPS
jgi:hypothetical protein